MPFVNISLYLICYYISKCILINNIQDLEEDKIRQFLDAIASQDSVLSVGLWMATELQQDRQLLWLQLKGKCRLFQSRSDSRVSVVRPSVCPFGILV